MKLRILLGGLLASGLALVPAAAHAKGATQATLTGPGVDKPVHLRLDDDVTRSLSTFSDRTGIFGATFGMTPDTNRLDAGRPAGDLGARYDVEYRYGPGSSVRQQIYPFARPVAVTYTRPGQRMFESEKTKGGWYRAPELMPVWIALGLPATPPVPRPPAQPRPPAGSSSSTLPAVPVVAGAGVFVLLIVLLVAFTPAIRTRIRGRRQPEPLTRPLR